MISSPSPTQQPSDLPPDTTGQKRVGATPLRKRPGQTPFALFVKGLLRPIFKGLYYLLKAVRGNKLLTLGIIVLLLASISLTSYFSTGLWPFGIGNDQFNFHIHGSDGGGENVKNWLYALRDGNVTTMTLLESQLIMSQPPDPTQLVNQYSQPKGHVNWQSINVTGVYSQADTSVDSFVSVNILGNGPGGIVKGVLIFHFTTLPQGRLLFIDILAFRPALQ